MVDNSLRLKNGNQIKVSLTGTASQIRYQIFNKDGDLCFDKVGGTPISISNRTDIMTHVKEFLPSHKRSETTILLDKTKRQLQKIVLALEGEAETEAVRIEQERELESRKKIHAAKKELKKIPDPILYVGTIIDWLTAGERINTLLCFIAGCSQIILKKPISVIGYGESASGKTHVESVALSLLPEQYIVIEKQVSPAALFNRAKIDEYFYDGKIVVYGDMGGEKDKDNQQEAFDLMKELQSDGKISKPVSVKDDSNNWVTEDLILYGNPCLWYTTIPTDIDSQELSRAIVFTPRMDNQAIFNKRGRALSFKKGRTYSLFENVKTKADNVPYMVEHLRQEMKDYIIINPFFDVITEILAQSKYYKRDTEKYVALLDTITALNFYQNEKYVFEDGTKAVITSKDDVHLLLSLLEPYKTSIAFNIKPKSAEIYSELTSEVSGGVTFADRIKFAEDREEWAAGFTSREYFEKSKIDLSLRSVQRYISDLYQAGLLTVKDRQNNTNLYDVVEHDLKETLNEIDYDSIADRTEWELGEEIAQIIRDDVETEDLNIHYKHDFVGGTPWG